MWAPGEPAAKGDLVMQAAKSGRGRSALYLSAGVSALTLISSAAMAQSTSLGEVTVTATRRGDVKVIDTPKKAAK